MKRLTLLFLLYAGILSAQDRALHIVLGSSLGTLGENSADLTPQPGFVIGMEYWMKNEKGNAWSVNATWNSFRRSNETKKETFEYLTLRALPLVWNLDKKAMWHIAAGGFANYLLVRNLRDGGSVSNSTGDTQRTYLGLSAGLGARLGEEGRSRLLIGLRDDFGLLGFGNGNALKFNTISLIVGLEL
ncbi:MAG: hypothetical protein SFV22_19505 [Saprospiraceae bacterium]|nr:hypothetical protein [Saprospiraceae bacterium]